MRFLTVSILIALAAVMSGCASEHQLFEGRRELNTMLYQSHLHDQVDNAIIRQSTVFSYQFVVDSSELNELGQRTLGVLAAHFKNHLNAAIGVQKEPRIVKVLFDFDESDIREDAEQVLNDAVLELEENPDAQILVTGRADVRGSEEYNQRLGSRRAEAARQYMLAKGIDPDRIRILSRGELDAMAPELDLAGMQEDRNAEFLLTDLTQERWGKTLNIRRGDASEALYDARVRSVVRFLEEGGVDSGLISITDGLVGGDGMPSMRVLNLLSEGSDS